jgi:hypothetical protein
MDKIIYIMIVLIFAAGCTKKDTSIEKIEKEDTTMQSKEPEDIMISEEKISNDAYAKNKTESNTLKDIEYNLRDIPAGIKFTGSMRSGVKWTDKNGENIIVISETDENRKGDFALKELYGYQFVKVGEVWEQVWKIQDKIKDCEFDVTLEYLNKSISITDLDNDGTAESTFLYALTCRSDVSPAEMKLLMHEGDSKYAIRGVRTAKIPGEEPYGGEMNIDKSFNNAPQEFLVHAKNEWEKYKIEKFE